MATMAFVETTISVAAIDEAVQRDGHLLARATGICHVQLSRRATTPPAAIEYGVALACWDQ